MHKVGINGIIDIFESANNAKNVKNATVFFYGNSRMNGVGGWSDRQVMKSQKNDSDLTVFAHYEPVMNP